MIDLKAKPFYLTDADIAWVEATKKSMTEEEKLEQLFFPWAKRRLSMPCAGRRWTA